VSSFVYKRKNRIHQSEEYPKVYSHKGERVLWVKGKEIIKKIAASKLSEIEKVKDEAEKAKLEAQLKDLKEAGLEAINNAKDHDAAVDATDEYQTKIDEINVPGEELPAPNYDKDNLTTSDLGSALIKKLNIHSHT